MTHDQLTAKGFYQQPDGSWSKRPSVSQQAPLRPLEQVVQKRMRQGDKPPTKLEADWRRHMEATQPEVKFRAQAIRFRLANGAWYKPDLMAWLNSRVVCWETKGPKQAKNVARGILTVKFAATAWPEVLFILVWRDAAGWHQQEVLP
jgi:hypothetical protein